MKKPFGFRQLLGYTTPWRGTLLFILLLMLAESGVSLMSPWLAGRFTEVMLTPEQSSSSLALPQLLACWFALLALKALLSFSNQYFIGKTGEAMLTGLREKLYDHLQALPVGYYHERKHGETLTLLTNDAAIISSFVTGTLVGLLPLFVTFAGALTLIFLIDPFIAVMAGSLIPFFYLVMKVLGRKIRPLSGAMMEAYARTFSIAEENLSLLPVIKSFTREEFESERFWKSSQELFGLRTRYLKIQALMAPIIRFLAGGAVLLLLWFAGTRIESGSLTAAELVSLLLYGMMLTQPVSSLASVYGQIQHTRGAAQRLIDVFSHLPEPLDQGRELITVNPSIRFSNIHFSYPGREPIIRGLSQQIEPGETVAIIGKNGAGKSTLIHLLMRFADPNQGEIEVDGVNIREVSITSLRSQVGLVQQNVLLLNGTVRENISFGRPDADMEAVETAARNAHALEFIQQLPQGFATVIGDQGIKLSGGQKQRLSLARVLLKDPPVLILDEATAMFDPEGERSFIQECGDLLRERTVILITHRPDSLALADRVLTLRDGQLEEGAVIPARVQGG